jgi:ribosomal-protein-alanine N-acetyltransferase
MATAGACRGRAPDRGLADASWDNPPSNRERRRLSDMPPFSEMKLLTERLELRPLVADDAPALFAIFSDPAVMRYWSTAPWSELQVALDYIERDRKAMAEGLFVRLGIVRAEDAALLGTCTLFSFDEQCRRAETGYGLATSAWGHGYACEAVTALLDWGFSALSLNRIEADIDPRNAASARALERLGFVREGHLRERWIVDGEVCDSLIYGLLAADWKAPR